MLAEGLASWVQDETKNLIESDYECAMGALSHVWSHTRGGEGGSGTSNRSEEGVANHGVKGKAKAGCGKMVPQHIQDRRVECVKDLFTDMGSPDETYESKNEKVLKAGKPLRYPCDVCRFKHWCFQCLGRKQLT